MKKAGVTLLEMMTAVAILSIITIPTVDLLSNFVTTEAQFNNDIKAKQHSINVTEKIIHSLRPAAYLYKLDTEITIPTLTSSTTVINGSNAIIALVPDFNYDGTISMPDSDTTSFIGIAFSIIPESNWNGENSDKYVLVQTILETETLDISIDPNDPMVVKETPPNDWNAGDSFLLASNLKPGSFNIQYDSFEMSDERDKVNFALVPLADGLYFPSITGTKSINDESCISSVVLRNWRDTTY